jgi:hypothetical protein
VLGVFFTPAQRPENLVFAFASFFPRTMGATQRVVYFFFFLNDGCYATRSLFFFRTDVYYATRRILFVLFHDTFPVSLDAGILGKGGVLWRA